MRLLRYWLADRLEGLAIRLNGNGHGLNCSSRDCPCYWRGMTAHQ